MADSVEETYARYGRLTFLKTPLQYSYIFTLALVVLLALLLAIFGSIEFAERLVKPIESLEEGTRSLSAGDAAAQIPKSGDDEISILVSSFMRAQKEAAWSDVARRMAHEINNPLTPIQLSAERIQKRFRGSSEEKDFIDASTKTIISQVDVLRDLVSAFSNFAEREKLSFTSTDINDLINESIQLFSRQHENISIYFEKGNLELVELDRNKIQQVLNNLLLNAIDACEEIESPKITFETKIKKINTTNYCEVAIKDNGQGFDESLIKNAFEPYQTSKKHGKGLGLAIVKSIIDEHKGEISISNNNVGASIKIYLPIH